MPRKSTQGVTRKDSQLVTVRVTKRQADRLARIADQASMTKGQLVRELIEMAAEDPVGVVRGLLLMRRNPEGKVMGVVREELDREAAEAAGQERLPGVES